MLVGGQADEEGSEEERENIPPAGTPPSERKVTRLPHAYY